MCAIRCVLEGECLEREGGRTWAVRQGRGLEWLQGAVLPLPEYL